MTNVIAETTSGKVRGLIENDVVVFRGIPYGASVGGSGRFQPPCPVEPATGIRDAAAFGETAPQINWLEAKKDTPIRRGRIRETSNGPAQGENCLVLNAWTPQVGPGDRPVMVFFHGGGYHQGSGSEKPNDGAKLARRGDVVVVSFNHRLGPLGYLYLGELGDDRFADSGNAGTLDILLALQWVKENVASLGGNPDNVTLFGFSGGSAKVSSLLGLSTATKLFHKAICQSGVDVHLRERDASAGARLNGLLHRLEVPLSKLDRLFDLSAEEILVAARSLRPAGYETNEFWPVVDGRVFAQDPVDAISSGSAADVRFMIGTMAQRDRWPHGL